MGGGRRRLGCRSWLNVCLGRLCGRRAGVVGAGVVGGGVGVGVGFLQSCTSFPLFFLLFFASPFDQIMFGLKLFGQGFSVLSGGAVGVERKRNMSL